MYSNQRVKDFNSNHCYFTSGCKYHINMLWSIRPSVRPSIYPRSDQKIEKPDFIFLSISSSSQIMMFPSQKAYYSSSSKFWVFPKVDFSQGLPEKPPEGDNQDILLRYPDHNSWLLLMQRSSTLNSPEMMELFTSYLILSLTTIGMKLISDASILVTIHNSWP